MVKAGLAENTIILTIQRTPSNFDTSPQALIELKNNGVTQKILDAMILNKGGGVPTTPQVNSNNTTPGFPSDYGLHYKQGEKWTKPERAYLIKTETRNVAKTIIGIGTPKYFHIFSGTQSTLQIVEQTPTFYFVYDPSMDFYKRVPDVFVIFRLEKNKDQRELQLTTGNMFSFDQGNKKALIKVKVNPVSERILAITPISELKAGEYLIGIQGDGGLYEFGISPPKN